MRKKNPYNFTIGFNEKNLQHIQAAEILNQLSRGEKADYLAKAILSYEGSLEEADTGAVSLDAIRHLVRQIMNEDPGTKLAGSQSMEPDSKEMDSNKKIHGERPEQIVDVSQKIRTDLKDANFIKNLSKNMAAFRGQ